MILVTGGASFNASDFLKTSDHKFVIILNKSKPIIFKENIVYFKSVKEFIDSEYKRKVKIIINFASSYNFRNNLKNNFLSSFYILFKIYKLLKNENLNMIINIGSYFQDSKTEKYTSYVFIKNFTDYFFKLIPKNIKYINLKLGDTYGPGDNRNKIFKHLRLNSYKDEINFSGNPNDIFYLTNYVLISKALNSIVLNQSLFINSNITIVRLFGEPITLLEIVNIYKKISNLNFKAKFNGKKITRKKIASFDVDYAFLFDKDKNKEISLI